MKIKIKNLIIIATLSISLSLQSISLIEIPYQISCWQKTDEKGVLMPYLTFPFLEALQSWDMSQWKVFEWGFGNQSTVWFGTKAEQYIAAIAIAGGSADISYQNASFKFRGIEGPVQNICTGGKDSSFVNAITEPKIKYDCVIINGVHRDACAEIALDYIKPGGIIVLNNSNQGSLGINSQKIFKLYGKYRRFDLKQPNHQDWATSYWIIN